MTWRFGLVWRVMEGSPLPHQDAPAVVWQRTRWADLPRYSWIVDLTWLSVGERNEYKWGWGRGWGEMNGRWTRSIVCLGNEGNPPMQSPVLTIICSRTLTWRYSVMWVQVEEPVLAMQNVCGLCIVCVCEQSLGPNVFVNKSLRHHLRVTTSGQFRVCQGS